MRPSKVIYDRAHSAIAEADAADFDFDAIMEGADWFTGQVSLPLSPTRLPNLPVWLAKLPSVTALLYL